jgi:hypothetical protein
MTLDLRLNARAAFSARHGKIRSCLLPDETADESGIRLQRASRAYSAAYAQPLDQRFVTRIIYAREIIEQLASLGHELEQSTPRMVILDVGLEVLGESIDALRKDRHLHLGRTGIACLGRIRLDDFGLTACG